MRRNAALAAAALAGAAVGALITRSRRRSSTHVVEVERGDHRADELRRKLAEARTASQEEDEFEVAGMGAETIVEEPRATPASEPQRAPAPPPVPAAPPADRGVGEEFEAMRRRIHEEGRSAAEEMRRAGKPSSDR